METLTNFVTQLTVPYLTEVMSVLKKIHLGLKKILSVSPPLGILLLCYFDASKAEAHFVHPQGRSVYVHLFEWTWKDIALECENYLGPLGYAGVQVSPPNEHALVEDNPWYQRYQPVSYKIESRSGTRAEFTEMVQRCKAVGVYIFVDAVINHMAWRNRTGHALFSNLGTPFYEYEHPGLYVPEDFHRCGRNGDNQIVNFSDRWESQNCDLTRCADLKTENQYVRNRLAGYLNDLLSLGVAGFRIDAAKHIPVEDLKEIFAQLKYPFYVYQEVINLGEDPVKPQEFFKFGDVTEFKYGQELHSIFTKGKLGWLQNFGEAWGFLPQNKAVVFLDNHDTQRNGSPVLTYKDGQLYTLANIFMLAWPYAYTQVMSSYSFKTLEQGPPAFENGQTKPVWGKQGLGCGGEWVCEHRQSAIANMVGFRNYVGYKSPVTHWWTDTEGGGVIAFAREGKGFVLINSKTTPYKAIFNTGLPEGLYCNVASSTFQKNDPKIKQQTACIASKESKNKRKLGYTSNLIKVDGCGFAEIYVDPVNAVVIYGGAKV